MRVASTLCDKLSVSDDELPFSVTHDRLNPSIRVHKLLHLSDLGFKSANLANKYNQDGAIVSRTGQTYSRFIGEDDCVLVNIVRTPKTSAEEMELAYYRAGPREALISTPKKRAAVVNCGGLCPGLNDVIHHIVEQLSYVYGVEHIYGIRGGYRGFDSTTPLDEGQGRSAVQHPRALHDPEGPGRGDGRRRRQRQRRQPRVEGLLRPVRLTPKMSHWHHEGGTNLARRAAASTRTRSSRSSRRTGSTSSTSLAATARTGARSVWPRPAPTGA